MRFFKKYYSIGLLVLGLLISSNLSAQSNELLADVIVQSYGCFHQDTTRLKLFKSDTALNVQLYKSNEIIGSATLSNRQLKSFERFISQLKRIKNNGMCTTVDYYKVLYKSKSFESVDGSCDWNGFDKLIAQLFKL